MIDTSLKKQAKTARTYFANKFENGFTVWRGGTFYRSGNSCFLFKTTHGKKWKNASFYHNTPEMVFRFTKSISPREPRGLIEKWLLSSMSNTFAT